MTFHKAISTAEDNEEPFGIEEVFFSRTDKRGVIQAGNTVFQRVSGYPWEKLIGAPHRVVRNPDTPKAVFSLLWRTIQMDRPLAAFVKNRSASGRWYWVLAAVVPTSDGYLSGRIKPTGTLFAHARTLYAELAAAEKAQGLSAEASCELMLQRLQDLGFPTYSDFSARALEEELSLRDTALGRSNAAQSRSLQRILESLGATVDEQSLLIRDFEALQSIPTNMRIIASRLEPSGGPISAISDNYKFASTEISRQIEILAGSSSNLCRSLAEVVIEALMLTGFARLLGELPAQFAVEDLTGTGVEFKRELALLSEIKGAYENRSLVALAKADRLSSEFNQSTEEIRRTMLGLDTIRVMGRVESGRLGSAGVGLASTIDQLDERHSAISGRLQKMMDYSAVIKANSITAQRQLRQSSSG